MTGPVGVLAVTPQDVASFLRNERRMGCNCDMDNWEPERVPYTGHTWVCRIHKAAKSADDTLKAEVATALARCGAVS